MTTQRSTPQARAISALSLVLLVAGCGSGGGGAVAIPPAGEAPPATPPPSTPAPPADPTPPPTADASSAVITGVTFSAASHKRMATGSDNWPMTWSSDGNQYAVWGDGGGFGGTESDGRASFGVARIEGDSGNYRGVNRFGGKGGECRSNIVGKGHGAPISIGGVLYVWVTPGSGASGYATFTLYRSNDKGCTWSRRNVQFARGHDHISYGSFVQFGQDNRAARDAYVYTIAAEISNASSTSALQRPGKIMLVRVPALSIEDRGTYEFYAGQDASGQPTWSTNPAARRAIYADAAGVGPFPQMAYVPGLDRMVYTNQHGSGSSTTGTQSLLTMAEAPNPWGPWYVFHRARFAPELERSVFQWNFAPKWFRNGGHDFTLIFSGHGSNDSWNTIDGTFTIQ
ncbi:MAG TPA: hypothetical protein VJQ52_10210 [Steroidobacteraceae bacterium]|nr:hypothetical protein [Steroidobacteraceae bacterium]